ncbi:alpha-L-rhamnosidase C-terminal domain-containing protein [Cohnella sp. WQ 127256]|uniref:alpha-L-rhamnosidase C-terminal domain-containing protein n=1 Tax=Cohnella sp. WQ 127256 TaxID=2938790 RepID=UPI0021181ABC|nr:alpha-L-rhamnosidase C-terminal domain-containing protein [Cohnella sp. WQ 127256]
MKENREDFFDLPQWIWHQDRINKKEIILSKSFTLAHDVQEVELHVALTGSLLVELDGEEIGRMSEKTQNICSFTRIDGFPNQLKSGQHEILFRIQCLESMPIEPASIHLGERLVGCIGFLQGKQFWLPTDESWVSDQSNAVMVCLLGEEPYGDLENSPDWFVAGGFRDVRTSPISDFRVISLSALQTVREEQGFHVSGSLGIHTLTSELRIPERTTKDIFYHVRKQREWQKTRSLQKDIDLFGAPQMTIDLLREYNVRFRTYNRTDAAILVLWNGAESLVELEHYNGAISEVFEVQAGSSFTTLSQGMRYVRLFIMGEVGEQIDLEIQFESVGVAMNQVGFVQSDLTLMDQIYEVSKHTNEICHQIGLWDGIKRDRLNWAYDFYMAAKADYVLWDDFSVLKRSIVELGHTPYGHWMNGTVTYTLWWINTIWEYYLHTADQAFVLQIKDDIIKQVQWIEDSLDKETGFFKERTLIFSDWAPIEEADEWIMLHAVLAITISKLNLINKHIPELELLIDWKVPSINESRFITSDSLITALFGIVGGYVGEREAKNFLLHYSITDPITPMSAYWFAECCARFDLFDKAWEAISLVWGRMLEEDATTFWEGVTLEPSSDFHHSLTTYINYSSYRMSLCHSWSSTPIQWVSRYVLGVIPLEPGYTAIKFIPHSIGLMTECKGTVNTPQGAIYVDWKLNQDGRMDAHIQLPQGVHL